MSKKQDGGATVAQVRAAQARERLAVLGVPAVLYAEAGTLGYGATAAECREGAAARRAEVAAFFEGRGFKVEQGGTGLSAAGFGLRVRYDYLETPGGVAHSLGIEHGGGAHWSRTGLATLAQVLGDLAEAEAAVAQAGGQR